jgi:hypothetical protein
MFEAENPIIWLISVIALGLVLILLRGHFTAAARERRRRDRSHQPVVSRKQGPGVKLAVNAGKSKGDRKR